MKGRTKLDVTCRLLPHEKFPEALAIRVKVFVEEQHVPLEEERDAYDDTALHFGAFVDGKMVGAGRVVLIDKKGKIGRVAILPEYRGLGIGTKIMETIMQTCREHKLDEVVLGAQLQALDFYEKLGFTAEGAVFDDGGIPHRLMRRPLSP